MTVTSGLVLALVGLPVLLPVLAAGLSLVVAPHSTRQRVLTGAVLTLVLADAIALLVVVERDGPVVVRAGEWAPPLGIVLVADLLAAMLLAIAVLVALAVLLFAVGQDSADRSGALAIPFHPAYLVLVAGIALAFLSGDLFNLFVAFEMLLAASYVLITLNAGEPRVRAGMTYVMTSLTSSLLFLTAIGLVYAATGTVNLADLADQVPRLEPGLRTALSLLLLVVFGIKAAVVPLHFWLPDSYPSAPAPITAVFAALLTKVGIYAMVRTQTLLFPRDDTWWVGAALAVATMLLGILGAIAQDDINRLLSFTLVSHVGFMVFGLALFDVAGLTGTILYIVHHITVQATLFLVAGLVVDAAGTPELSRMERGERERPLPAATGVLFLLGALSLAGVPPFSGFIAKFALLRAAVAHGGTAAYLLAAAALVTSLLTLYAMVRVWRGAFAPPGPPKVPLGRRLGTPRLAVAATLGMAATGVLLALGAGPLSDLSERAAAGLVRLDTYRDAVLGGGAP
ncbi:Na+/H+ antiporter subunit D [Streptomyces sp. JJ66]|uniref:proton-conducting transporter transmembrane domain-containing protein n=1 Tax=Streptomyces sp. JJ66 TaxID=2803843 RepID=UPI001C56CC0C|nr:proton-conducting transporter membrane subunit [Streptomyces sp. JJ66]MBW1603965.1 Na+/H+ antiporter subunit D [Streptomyces sp. JJ66]